MKAVIINLILTQKISRNLIKKINQGKMIFPKEKYQIILKIHWKLFKFKISKKLLILTKKLIKKGKKKIL
jgi:hypothetical protein